MTQGLFFWIDGAWGPQVESDVMTNFHATTRRAASKILTQVSDAQPRHSSQEEHLLD